MKFVKGIGQSKSVQSVIENSDNNVLKKLATGCLVLSLGVAIFGSQQVLAESEGRLGGYTLEDESMLGRYGDVNDEWVGTSSVSSVGISSTQMSSQMKRSNSKPDNRLGAFSMEDDAMLGRYGDKDDEF